MPKWSVIVTRDATESCVVEVVALNEEEAETKAMEIAEDFTLDDCNFHPPYTNGADLIEDSKPCKTRADLFQRPAWQPLAKDTSGNPCVWLNYYEGYEDEWSSQCDDDGCAPYHSDWIGPADEAEVALWESLPNAA